jgi:secreted trypsin-like serine protease
MKSIFVVLGFSLLTSLSIHAMPIIGGEVDYVDNNNGIFQLEMLEENSASVCTATKISESFAITAAHCLLHKNIKSLGFSVLSENSQLDYKKLDYKKIYIHPDYNKLPIESDLLERSATSDIALIKIIPNAEFKKIKSVKINFDFIEDLESIVFWGYGCQSTINVTESQKPVRKYTEAYTLDSTSLLEDHGILTELYTQNAETIYSFNLVTPGRGRTKTASSLCPGDSGGPTLLRGDLVGINSYYTFADMAQDGATAGVSYLNLHARISKAKGWILETMKK